jgi:asparagine synthase (glutamine-hydrolysing)
MCGFAVVLQLRAGMPDLRHTIERMTAVIRHRGPDDEGDFFAGPVAMGFRRLSILDMSPLGHQPMPSDDGRVTLVYNGEIYNYVELREELQALGHRFKSTGDTEVLLRAYLEWGTDCVRRFNGMWAFVIHDQRRGKLFGSRDRFGMKPLYHYADRDHVMLGSEIKAIRASGLYRDAINWRTASRYLLEARLDDTADTFYENIRQIAAGTAFELDLDGRFRQWRYWSVDDVPFFVGGDPAQAFGELFEDAVRVHIRSDVPVGVHLSGGLDSTSIICALARQRERTGASGPLKAFSFIAPEFDESRYIDDTIAQTHATLIKLKTDPVRLWGLLREVLWYQDEPIYSMMPLVSYELMRLAATHGIKVVLNGQGADETLAGYGTYFGDYWCTLLGAGRVPQAWSEIGNHVAAHGGSRARLMLRQMRRMAQSGLGRVAPYRSLASWKRRRAHGKHEWYTPQLTEQLPDEKGNPTGTALNDALAYSVYRTPLPRILRIEDRNAMAHSIEARLPFLDCRLVSLAFGLPPNWRLRGPWNKYVLREAMRGRIPESVRTRVDKMGFPVPANRWFADALYEPVLDLLTSRHVRERGTYHVDSIIRDVQRHGRREVDVSGQIFDVAQFEVWSAL